MNYHVMIQTEQRTSTPEKPRQLAESVEGQLHTMGASVTTPIDANILYAASWDGTSPWITVLKGQISDLKMAFAGWPMVDQATWEAANPPPSTP